MIRVLIGSITLVASFAACSGTVTEDASSGDGATTDSPRTDVIASDNGDTATTTDTGPACGNPGDPCCFGSACNAGGCCVNTRCVATGSTCPDGLGTCSAGSCGSCGGAGQACCMETMSDVCSGTSPACPGCTASGTTCSSQAGGTSGTCVACGAEGQRCCGIATCLETFALCAAEHCTSQCGHPGEPCCQNETCRDGGCCMAGTMGPPVCVASPTCGCTAGHCTSCGVMGGPCCPGATPCEWSQGSCMGDGSGGMICTNGPHP